MEFLKTAERLNCCFSDNIQQNIGATNVQLEYCAVQTWEWFTHTRWSFPLSSKAKPIRESDRNNLFSIFDLKISGTNNLKIYHNFKLQKHQKSIWSVSMTGEKQSKSRRSARGEQRRLKKKLVMPKKMPINQKNTDQSYFILVIGGSFRKIK